MFCDSDRCSFDLWAPAGGVIANRAFSAYAMHQSNLDSIVDKILQESDCHDKDFSMIVPIDLSNSDIDYIQEELQKRSFGKININ